MTMPLFKKYSGRSLFAGFGAVAFLLIEPISYAYAGSAPHHGGEYADISLHEQVAAHAEGHSGGLPQLDPSSFETQLFWLVLVFVTMYFVFSRQSLPAISEVIESRKEHIRNDLDSAQDLKRQVEAVQKSYEENLEKARRDALNSYKQAEDEVKRNTETQVREFYARSTKQIGEMEKKIEKAKAEAMKDINKVASEIAVDAAEKIIGIRVKEAKAA